VGCLEIWLLICMCRYLNRTATAKGRPGWPFAVLMVFAWLAAGITGAVVGYLAEGMPNSEFSIGAVLGYVCGVAIACAGMAVIVNAIPGVYTYEQGAMDDERAYVEWRKRQGARPKKARLADDEGDEEPVDLQPADAPPPPRAQRAWKRRDWDG
jgi:hypothetical protein